MTNPITSPCEHCGFYVPEEHREWHEDVCLQQQRHVENQRLTLRAGMQEATLTSCESRLGRLVEADRKLIQELQAKVIELERAKFNEPRVRELVAEMMRGVKDDLREMDVDVADAEERFDAAIRSFRAFRAWLTKPKRKPAAVSHPKGWGKPVGKGRRRAPKPKGGKAKRRTKR